MADERQREPAPNVVAADERNIAAAARLLVAGELVAFPTETVYGLGGDATNDRAVARIFEAKGQTTLQSADRAFSRTPMPRALRWPSTSARDRLAERFWPGALTLVLPRRPDCTVSLLASAGLDSLAVRVPRHAVAHALLVACGRPIAAPSANASGKISPTTAEHVARSLGVKVAMILDGGRCPIGIESTVLDLTGPTPVLLRPGGVTSEELTDAIGPLAAPAAADGAAPKSPGMLASHYAPELPLRLDARDVRPREALLAFGACSIAGAAALENLSPRRRSRGSSGQSLRHAARTWTGRGSPASPSCRSRTAVSAAPSTTACDGRRRVSRESGRRSPASARGRSGGGRTSGNDCARCDHRASRATASARSVRLEQRPGPAQIADHAQEPADFSKRDRRRSDRTSRTGRSAGRGGAESPGRAPTGWPRTAGSPGSRAIAKCTQPLHRLQTPSNSMTGLPFAMAERGSSCSLDADMGKNRRSRAAGSRQFGPRRKGCCAATSRARLRAMNELLHPRRQPVPGDVLERIKAIVGPKGWSDDAAVLAPQLIDWRRRYQGRTPLLVRPASTPEVAAVVRLCAEARRADRAARRQYQPVRRIDPVRDRATRSC